MKTYDLKQFEIRELSVLEMKNLNGGGFWLMPFVAGVILSGVVGEIIRDGVKKCLDDFKAGYESIKDNK